MMDSRENSRRYRERKKSNAAIERCIFCWMVRKDESERDKELFACGVRYDQRTRKAIGGRTFRVHRDCLAKWNKVEQLILKRIIYQGQEERMKLQGFTYNPADLELIRMAERYFHRIRSMRIYDLNKDPLYLTFVD